MKLGKMFLLALFAVLALSLTFMVACGDDDDDDDDDSSSSDDATTDDDGGSGTFAEAQSACIEAYQACGLDEATATQYCSFLDSYESAWNDCFATALTNYFDCLTASECADAATCATDFSTDTQACY